MTPSLAAGVILFVGLGTVGDGGTANSVLRSYICLCWLFCRFVLGVCTGHGSVVVFLCVSALPWWDTTCHRSCCRHMWYDEIPSCLVSRVLCLRLLLLMGSTCRYSLQNSHLSMTTDVISSAAHDKCLLCAAIFTKYVSVCHFSDLVIASLWQALESVLFSLYVVWGNY